MSRIIFFLVIFLLAVHCSFGQATPVVRYRITNNTTTMGVNMPTGTQVFDVAGQKLYIALRPVPVTITIQTGLEAIDPYFKEFVFVPEIQKAPDGTEVVELASSSGRIWMDRNLGASQAATSSTDYLAYGSLFQWCRAADGHEKINWNSATTGSANNTSVNSRSSTAAPETSIFFAPWPAPYDWLATPVLNGDLWWSGTIAGANSPCPTEYHVPTRSEWETELALFTSAGGNNLTGAFGLLKLPMAGYRSIYGDIAYTGSNGYYWSSSYYEAPGAWGLDIYPTSAYIFGNGRSYGFSVRCIKDQ